MPDVTYADASQYPFADDTSTIRFDRMWFDATNPDRTLCVVNGLLDEDNCDASDFTVRREHVQPGSCVKVFQVSGTANMDYFGDIFADYSTASFTAGLRDVEQVVPGAAMRFYLPWAAECLVLHGCFMGNNSTDDANNSRMYIRVDGTWENNHLRGVGQSMAGTSNRLHYGTRKNRWWSGSNLVTLSQGYHDIGLFVVADKDVGHTRVWSRHLIVVAFRQYS